GINSELGIAMIPSYDIPSANIDENARQFRFSNGTTTDDRALHLVGYEEKPNGTWFLIKDSGSEGHNIKYDRGYYFYDEDLVKVKCDDGKIYVLHRFNISIFTRKPLQTIEYGTGEEGGIPILAENAIKRAKAGDTVILKNAVYFDANKAEQKLPVISFQLK